MKKNCCIECVHCYFEDEPYIKIEQESGLNAEKKIIGNCRIFSILKKGQSVERRLPLIDKMITLFWDCPDFKRDKPAHIELWENKLNE